MSATIVKRSLRGVSLIAKELNKILFARHPHRCGFVFCDGQYFAAAHLGPSISGRLTLHLLPNASDVVDLVT